MNELNVKQGTIVPARRGREVYFEDGFYGMHSDGQLEQYGMSKNLPPSQRLQNSAVGRMNRWGHAPFAQGELAEVLGVSLPTMRKALKTLVDADIAAPESTYLCIVLSARAYRRADRANRHCAEPRHFNRQTLMWGHGGLGWEPHPDAWRELLQDKDARTRVAAGQMPWQQITITREVRTERESVQITTAGTGIANGIRCPRCGRSTLVLPPGGVNWCSGCGGRWDDSYHAIAS